MEVHYASKHISKRCVLPIRKIIVNIQHAAATVRWSFLRSLLGGRNIGDTASPIFPEHENAQDHRGTNRERHDYDDRDPGCSVLDFGFVGIDLRAVLANPILQRTPVSSYKVRTNDIANIVSDKYGTSSACFLRPSADVHRSS
jgi:hypothetical protein